MQAWCVRSAPLAMSRMEFGPNIYSLPVTRVGLLAARAMRPEAA